MKKRHEIKFDDKDMFYILHTTYIITEEICEAIAAIEGVDKIDLEMKGKYTLFFTVGVLFDESTVARSISSMLRNTLEI